MNQYFSLIQNKNNCKKVSNIDWKKGRVGKVTWAKLIDVLSR